MGTSSIPAQFTEAELKLLQMLVYQECGMYFDERRTHFLQDRLQRRLKACQLDSFYSYYRLLISKEGKDELARLLENLTVNETSFFRNKAQLDLFHKHVFDDLIRRKQDQRDWLLAHLERGLLHRTGTLHARHSDCDSLAYYYLRNPLPFDMPSPKPLIPPPWKVEIVASDISYSASAYRAGRHLHRNPDGSVDYTCRLRYFDKSGDKYAIKPAAEATRPVRLSQSQDRIPAAAQRHYSLPQRDDLFRRAEQKRLSTSSRTASIPQGYLFVGHAESLFGPTQKFRMVHAITGPPIRSVEVIVLTKVPEDRNRRASRSLL